MAFSFFDESWYLTTNSDVAFAVSQGHFSSGLEHYQLFGAREERNASAEFNTAYYMFWNADLKAAMSSGAFVSPVDHFESFGVAEDRAPNHRLADFDTDRYLADNPDVALAVSANAGIRSAMEHYILFGVGEDRAAFTHSGAVIPPGSSDDDVGVVGNSASADAGGM